jgi:transcriptional regulator with XRE-family HTH domain
MYRRIRGLREDKDWTQKQVATLINCSQQVYSNYELGQRDVPTQTLLALAKLHKTSVDYLLGITDEPRPYPRNKSGQ